VTARLKAELQTPTLTARLKAELQTPTLYTLLLIALIPLAGCQTPSSPATGKDEIDLLLKDENYVKISPGDFLMGSPPGPGRPRAAADDLENRERPQHRALITKPFEMGKYEVTQEQWQAVIGANPSAFKGPKTPVTNVSWNDAQEFINRLQTHDDRYTYRLPTEAEWEYACRAGSSGNFSGEDFKEPERQKGRNKTMKGNKPAPEDVEEYAKNLKEMGWYDANAFNHPHPVGRLKPNAWGLYDMHGNVREWCQDWYDSNYYKTSPAEDPPGPPSGATKVNRGGSWQAPAVMCRSTARSYDLPTERNSLIGFRLVRVKREAKQ
jgi:formylglycine-generating enzyme required for sulfatase activity